MHVLKVIFIIFEVVLLFNLLIFVHELGHFLAARWRGLKIERFAVWFGKPIWKKRIDGVEFCLGCIPAGGYVSLPQMAPMEMIEGKNKEGDEVLPPISATDKIIVAFAGPLFSFLLAVVFALIVWKIGRPVNEGETTRVIGYVVEGGPADLAGLKPGDEILEVDDKPVTKFGGMGDSVSWRVVRSEGETIPVKVNRIVDGKAETLRFEPVAVREKTKAWQRKGLRQISVWPAQSSIIAEVVPDSPASLAGLRPGDEILSVNGERLHHFAGLADYIDTRGDQPLALVVRRGAETLEVKATPEIPISPPDQKKPRVGIVWNGDGKRTLAYPGPVEQVRASVMAMVNTFEALFARKSDISPQHLAGAVKIMEVYYRLFDTDEGWRLAIWFSVLMNVNLALLNMVPIPVLDGGHILLAIVEGVRRRPVSARILNVIQTSCAVLLIGFMLYIFFFDVQELPWKRSKENDPPALKFAPKELPAK